MTSQSSFYVLFPTNVPWIYPPTACTRVTLDMLASFLYTVMMQLKMQSPL